MHRRAASTGTDETVYARPWRMYGLGVRPSARGTPRDLYIGRTHMLHICSLLVDDGITVTGADGYTLLPFPYDSESHDPHGMHEPAQPDGAVSAYPDDRSALIWPSMEGWGVVTTMLQWEAGSYTELRDQIIRDPLNLSTGENTTATNHRPPSRGMQCFTGHHELFVDPDTPLAIRVAQDDSTGRRIVHAQFKLAIHQV